MDEGFFVAVFVSALLILAAIGGAHLAMDFREFDRIVAQCEKQGYIQNDKVRVMCTKEK